MLQLTLGKGSLDRNCELKKYTNYHKHFAPVFYRGEAVSAEHVILAQSFRDSYGFHHIEKMTHNQYNFHYTENLIRKFEEFQYNENTGLKEVESGSS